MTRLRSQDVRFLPYSYVILKENNIIKAINSDGKIEFKGTDAATVIQSAVNALTNGGKIFIKDGTYVISSKISLPYEGLLIEGSERKATILGMSSAGEFSIENEYVSLKNLWFDGLSGATKNFINNDAVTGRKFGITLENLWMYRRSNVFLISLNDVEQLTIKGCHFEDFGQRTWFDDAALVKLYVTGQYHAGNVFIHDNIFRPCIDAGTGDQVPAAITIVNNSTVKDFGGAKIYSNHFAWVGLNENIYGIHLRLTGSRYIVTLFVFDNRFENLKLIYTSEVFQGSGGMNTIYIIDNLCNPKSTASSYPTIRFSDHTSLCRIARNAIGGAYAISIPFNYAPYCNIVEDNRFDSGATLSLSATTKCSRNFNYVTENSGTATISSGSTIGTGLATVPTVVGLSYRGTINTISLSWNTIGTSNSIIVYHNAGQSIPITYSAYI